MKFSSQNVFATFDNVAASATSIKMSELYEFRIR